MVACYRANGVLVGYVPSVPVLKALAILAEEAGETMLDLHGDIEDFGRTRMMAGEWAIKDIINKL